MNKPIEELIQRLKEPDYKYYGCELSRGEAELAISALEKQIPKKPLQGKEYYWIDSVKYRGRYRDVKKKAYDHRCPSCGEIVSKLTNSFCNYCGQSLDWRNEDE